MSRILLAVPALFPLGVGMAMLIWNHLASAGTRGKALSMDGETKELSAGEYRHLEFFTGAVTVANSLFVCLLIWKHAGSGQQMVLFRLYGDLKVSFKLDGMGSVFAGLVACLWPLAVLYSFEYMRHEKRKTSFFAYYLMTYGVTVGIAFAGNLVTLYLFYELLTLVTFPLVLHPMTKEAVRASRRYLYYSIGGAAFAFIGLVFVLSFSSTGNTDFLPGGVLDLAAAAERRDTLLLVYVLAFFGFGVKAAVFPCHGWLPRATVAPTPVTALLHAVAVVKSGAFAILRLTYFSFGTAFLRGSWAQAVVMAAALVTIVFGSTMAVREVHWKKRLAYSTISNLSYILFGAAMMSPFGLMAALSHMVFHGVMKICSFFCAGAVMHQSGKEYIYEVNGLGKRMPVTFGCLTVASLSLIGIPLFAGFISKWNLAEAAFACGEAAFSAAGGSAPGWLPLAGIFVLLYSALMTAVYMLTVLVLAYFPQMQRVAVVMESGGEEVKDPNWMMLVPLLLFAAAIVGLGLHSAPLMRVLAAIGGEAG